MKKSNVQLTDLEASIFRCSGIKTGEEAKKIAAFYQAVEKGDANQVTRQKRR